MGTNKRRYSACCKLKVRDDDNKRRITTLIRNMIEFLHKKNLFSTLNNISAEDKEKEREIVGD